jgi:hypothetical protein
MFSFVTRHFEGLNVGEEAARERNEGRALALREQKASRSCFQDRSLWLPFNETAQSGRGQ